MKPGPGRLTALPEILSIEEQAKRNNQRAALAKKQQESREAEQKRTKDREDLLIFLKIPHDTNDAWIEADKLLKFLMDPVKFKVLATKLNNKAFW